MSSKERQQASLFAARVSDAFNLRRETTGRGYVFNRFLGDTIVVADVEPHGHNTRVRFWRVVIAPECVEEYLVEHARELAPAHILEKMYRHCYNPQKKGIKKAKK